MSSHGFRRSSSKRHLTLPIFDDFNDFEAFVKIPIHQTESDEMKYVKTVLENHSIPNAFDGLSTVLAKTNYKSVHKEITRFVLKCLDQPLDIAQCMERNKHMKRSFSSDFDSSLLGLKPNRVRQSISMSVIQTMDENNEDENQDEVEVEDDEEKDDSFLIELLNCLPTMIPNFTKDEQAKVLQKIPQIFISLAPDPAVLNVKGIPKFVYFKAATQCATSILRKNKDIIDKSDVSQLGKMVIIATFTCSSNIGDIVRMTKSKFTSYLSYINECLPFFATLIPIIGQSDTGFILLLQQFWVSIIVQTSGDLSMFTRNIKDLSTIISFMPPFISGANNVDYKTLSAYVLDILNKLKINLYQKRNEEFAEALHKIAPNVPIKTVLSLPLADIVLLLSIAMLEKSRASMGNLVPMFEYFEVDFYPEFSQCLDAISFPVFMSFQSYIQSELNVAVSQSKIIPVVSHIFKNYPGRNPRVLSFFDKISQPLIMSQPLSICSHESMLSFLTSYAQLKYEKSSRLDSFKELGNQMFQKCIEQTPNALNAVIHNILNKETPNLFSTRSDLLSVVLELYPSNKLIDFTHQLSMKQRAYGMVGFLSHRQILKFENIDDRLLLLAFHYIHCSNKTAENDLTSNATPQLSLLIWSHISMVPDYRSKEFIFNLATKFIDMVNGNKGIFDTKNINSSEIEFQATVLIFFNEQLNLKTYADDIFAIIAPMLNKEFNSSPAIITALIPLASFICTSVIVPHTNIVMRLSLIYYVLRLILELISIHSKPNLYKFLKENDIDNLRLLVDQFSHLTKTLDVHRDISTILNNHTNCAKIGPKATLIFKKLVEAAKTDNLIMTKISDTICFLLANEYSFFSAYFSLATKTQTSSFIQKYLVKPRNYNLNTILPYFWQICPTSIPSICEILNVYDQVIPLIPQLLIDFPAPGKFIPSLIAKAAPECLNSCKVMPPETSLCLLKPEILEIEESSKYVEKCLEQFTIQNALLYIPQFVQALRYDKYNAVQEFLLEFCKKSDSFTHFLLWNIASEKGKANIDEQFQMTLINLEGQIMFTMSTDEQQHYDNELQFINNISEISARLLPLSFEERKTALVDELSKLIFTDDLYVPSNPEYRILEIDGINSIPLKSHSRVPILVRFKAKKIEKPKKDHLASVFDALNPFREKPIYISCIFKIQDDVRMDALMIQLIDRIYNIIKDSDIDCYLLPYRIYATGDKRGVIECIQNAKSRHELGELTKSSLLKYFISVYGLPGTPDFERAQNNFIASMAPYSLICYLFQVKDRHNANIMIDDEGHVIHIDFGFIFDISPGGNMKFEKAPFKLNSEMIDLLGGSVNAAPFIKFSELFTKCFVIVRSHFEEIEAIAYLMKDAGLPCFKNDSFKKLRERFFLDKPGIDLQNEIYTLVKESVGSVTTVAYDAFQAAQNGIFYI